MKKTRRVAPIAASRCTCLYLSPAGHSLQPEHEGGTMGKPARHQRLQLSNLERSPVVSAVISTRSTISSPIRRTGTNGGTDLANRYGNRTMDGLPTWTAER